MGRSGKHWASCGNKGFAIRADCLLIEATHAHVVNKQSTWQTKVDKSACTLKLGTWLSITEDGRHINSTITKNLCVVRIPYCDAAHAHTSYTYSNETMTSLRSNQELYYRGTVPLINASVHACNQYIRSGLPLNNIICCVGDSYRKPALPMPLY